MRKKYYFLLPAILVGILLCVCDQTKNKQLDRDTLLKGTESQISDDVELVGKKRIGEVIYEQISMEAAKQLMKEEIDYIIGNSQP